MIGPVIGIDWGTISAVIAVKQSPDKEIETIPFLGIQEPRKRTRLPYVSVIQGKRFIGKGATYQAVNEPENCKYYDQ